MSINLGTPSMGALQHLLTVKLNPSNYIMWRNQMDPHNNCFDMKKFIDPVAVVPVATIMAKDRKESMTTHRSQFGSKKISYSRAGSCYHCPSR